MKIATKYFGEIELDKEQVIQFPQGLPGFYDRKQFVMIDLADNPLFKVLQAVDHADTAFIITSPYQFYQEYSFDVDDNTLQLLKIDSEQDVVVYSIVTLKEPFAESTINLQAPIVVNQTKQLAKQYITNNNKFLTKAAINQKEAE